ncbi:MAG: C39 family peptidase [Patescibacteria group bacterium]|nr:C39 family peptidase [Patescibacteria group bacterium]
MTNTKRKAIIWAIIVVVIGVGLSLGYQKRAALSEWWDSLTKPDIPAAQPSTSFTNANANSLANVNTNTNINNNAAPEQKSLPVEINLKVPFTSQAPFANWDLPYQEACEETASLMVHHYLQDKPFASKDEADKEILELVDFENEKYGAYEHTTAKQTVQLIKDKWGYKQVDLLLGSEVTIERIKQEVANGYPVIVLAAGRELGNPNYKQPGPLYHALVIKGYLKDGTIITNDPGTRKGADYLYAPNTLLEAIHDWNNGDVPNGQRNMIIVRPND